MTALVHGNFHASIGPSCPRRIGTCACLSASTTGHLRVMEWLGDVLVWWGASKAPTKIAVWIMALAFAGILVVAGVVLVDEHA
jgi:hypothetical protein